jgi:predicted RNA-binding Zn ribbon-like protein
MSANIYRPVPDFYGDHPALDLMNTVMLVDGVLTDTWQSDADVLNWLKAAAMAANKDRAAPGLLDAGRALREVVRTLVLDKKAGKPLRVKPLNAALAHAQRHIELQADGEEWQLVTHYAVNTPQAMLAPLAEAAAELLATVDFNLVRKCEDSDCVLWFVDKTKAHRRRWCSMALCGNRNKVASFRQRQQREA